MKHSIRILFAWTLAGLLLISLCVSAFAIGFVGITANDEHPDYPAIYAGDGDEEHFWHTDWQNGPQTPPFIITFELDGEYDVSSIGLLPRQDGNLNGLIYWFNVYSSLDGENFEFVKEVDDFIYDSEVQEVTFSPAVHTKYIRIEALDTEGASFASLNELYVNGEACKFVEGSSLAAAVAEAAYVPTDEEILADTKFASITADSENGDYKAVYAGDGNLDNFWHTDWNEPIPEPPHTITFELKELYTISELILTRRLTENRNGVIYAFDLSVSEDGENFVPAGSYAGIEYGEEDGTAAVKLDTPVKTKFLRLTATQTETDYASLNELDFVGEPYQPTDADILAATRFTSVEATSAHADYKAVYAADGDTSRFWHTDWERSDIVPPFSITFGLNDRYKITELSLVPRLDGNRNGCIKAFNLWTSVDGENYVLSGTYSGLEYPDDKETITLEAPVIASWLRLEAIETEGDFASLNEFDFVGAPTTEDPAAPGPEPDAPAEPEPDAPAEPEPDAPAEPEPEPAALAEPEKTVETSPNTFDFGLFMLIESAVMAIGAYFTGKKH